MKIRGQVLLKNKLPSNTLVTESNHTTNKYDFIPSFKQHKNLNFDANLEYRKFKSNKHMANSHKLHSVKIKKIFKARINNVGDKSSDAKLKIASNNDEVNIEDMPNNEMSDYRYDHEILPQIHESRGNGTPDMHDLRRVGDNSVNMSKETEEAMMKSHPRPLTLTPGKNTDNLISKKSSEYIRDSLNEDEFDDYSDIEKHKMRSIPAQPLPYDYKEKKETPEPQPLQKELPSKINENIKVID